MNNKTIKKNKVVEMRRKNKWNSIQKRQERRKFCTEKAG
jgi:hypothetical protein